MAGFCTRETPENPYPYPPKTRTRGRGYGFPRVRVRVCLRYPRVTRDTPYLLFILMMYFITIPQK